MNHNQNSAERADTAVLELAGVLSDGNWHRTSYLAMAAGKYLRPEVAWRASQGVSVAEGQRKYINAKLQAWERAGRVERRRNGTFTEWRLARTDWVDDYLAELDKRRAERAANGTITANGSIKAGGTIKSSKDYRIRLDEGELALLRDVLSLHIENAGNTKEVRPHRLLYSRLKNPKRGRRWQSERK